MEKHKLKEKSNNKIQLDWYTCKSGSYHGKMGKLGELRIFEIYYDPFIHDYFLICYLPGVRNDIFSRFPTEEKGIDIANKTITEWVNRAGLIKG